MINLERREERRNRMLALFDLMNIDVKIFNAVDGRKLDEQKLKELNVSVFRFNEKLYCTRKPGLKKSKA